VKYFVNQKKLKTVFHTVQNTGPGKVGIVWEGWLLSTDVN